MRYQSGNGQSRRSRSTGHGLVRPRMLTIAGSTSLTCVNRTNEMGRVTLALADSIGQICLYDLEEDKVRILQIWAWQLRRS